MRDILLGRLENTLPPGWLWKQLVELVDHSQNGISKRRSSVGNPTSVLRLADIREGRIDASAPRDIMLSQEEVNKYALRDGDLLCIRVNGSRSLTGRLVYFRTPKVWTYCDHFIRFRLKPEITDSKYVAYYFNTQAVRTYLSKHMVSTAGQNTVSQGTMLDIAVPVAPVHQQQVIVAEIEKQFSRLDEAIANLKRVKVNLKRYKAAVLKSAVEGKLTEDWRKQHPNVESARKLLDRILAERRAKWNGRGKYKEPSAPETADFPSLPRGWTWATVEQLSLLVQYGSSAKTHEEEIGVPVLRMGNIEDGRLRFDLLKYLPKKHDEFPGLFLREGDILFNRTNSAELVGKTAVYKGKPAPCSFASYLIRVRLTEACAPDLLAYFTNSVFGRAWIARVVSQQVGQANVNGTKLQALVVPLPPIDEQGQIIAEVERRLSVIEELEATAEANLIRADRLRQSILSQAFSGRLLSQVSKDIPSAVAICSIAAESPASYGKASRARQ